MPTSVDIGNRGEDETGGGWARAVTGLIDAISKAKNYSFKNMCLLVVSMLGMSLLVGFQDVLPLVKRYLKLKHLLSCNLLSRCVYKSISTC